MFTEPNSSLRMNLPRRRLNLTKNPMAARKNNKVNMAPIIIKKIATSASIFSKIPPGRLIMNATNEPSIVIALTRSATRATVAVPRKREAISTSFSCLDLEILGLSPSAIICTTIYFTFALKKAFVMFSLIKYHSWKGSKSGLCINQKLKKMTNYLHDIPTGPNPPSEINVVIEMTRASKNKYEYDPENNVFRLDRVLYTFAPFDYGFMPQTLDDDGDPLDVVLLIDEPTFTSCVVHARPIGIMEMDDAGKVDDKIIAVPMKDPYYRDVKSILDLPRSRIEELTHFYATYKIQEGGHTEVRKFRELSDAYKTIKRCIDAFDKKE